MGVLKLKQYVQYSYKTSNLCAIKLIQIKIMYSSYKFALTYLH